MFSNIFDSLFCPIHGVLRPDVLELGFLYLSNIGFETLVFLRRFGIV